MNRLCTICKEKITVKTIKDEAKGNSQRQRMIYKDLTVCIASGYCIKCLRKKKTSHTDEELETEIRTKLNKAGISKKEIEKQLPELKQQYKDKKLN